MSAKKFDFDAFKKFSESEEGQRIRDALAELKQTYLSTMTPERALFIRELRSSGYTWRAVAAAADKEWNGDWGSNQIDGMYICEAAAEFLGEDPQAEPWN